MWDQSLVEPKARMRGGTDVSWKDGEHGGLDGGYTSTVGEVGQITKVFEVLDQRCAHVIDAVSHVLDLLQPAVCSQAPG
jgi:hypothetical protein